MSCIQGWLALSPFLDEDGVLRVKGRTNNSGHLDYGTMNPVIVDPKHGFTRLLLHHHHVMAGHHGQERVANDVRQRYWILDLRTTVRSTWSSCQECKMRRCQPGVVEMAPLPEVRVTQPSRPFAWTGMDYFGALSVTIGRRHEKRYGVLFTCLSFKGGSRGAGGFSLNGLVYHGRHADGGEEGVPGYTRIMEPTLREQTMS